MFQTNPVRVELLSYVNAFFCSNQWISGQFGLPNKISPVGAETFSYLHAFFHSNKFASGQVNENALYISIILIGGQLQLPAPFFRILTVSAYSLSRRTGVIFSAFFRQAQSKQGAQTCATGRCLPPSHLFSAHARFVLHSPIKYENSTGSDLLASL